MTPGAATSVKQMPAWVLAIVPKPKGEVITIKSGREDVERDTMPYIIKRIKQTAWQTKQLANELKGKTEMQSLRNAWNFVKDHIRYKEDDPYNEEVRDPSVTIHEGIGDCDCQTVLLGTLLYNMGIKFQPRIIEQWNSGEWTHIYLIVPKPGAPKKLTSRTDYTVLDCVMDRFDQEPDFTNYKDYNMGLAGLKSLRGVDVENSICRKTPIINELKYYVQTESVIDHGLIPTKEMLVTEKIPYTETVDGNGDEVLVIDTKQGPVALPTIITPDEASQIKTIKNVPTTGTSEFVEAEVVEQPTQSQAGFGWLFGALLVSAVIGMAVSEKKKAAGLGKVKEIPTKIKHKGKKIYNVFSPNVKREVIKPGDKVNTRQLKNASKKKLNLSI